MAKSSFVPGVPEIFFIPKTRGRTSSRGFNPFAPETPLLTNRSEPHRTAVTPLICPDRRSNRDVALHFTSWLQTRVSRTFQLLESLFAW